MCHQGVVNTRQSSVFAALFTRLFCTNVGGSVSLSPAHQLRVRHVGNAVAGLMRAKGLWGWQLCASSHAFQDPQAARLWCAVNSDQLFNV